MKKKTWIKAKRYCEAHGYLIDPEATTDNTVIAYDRRMNRVRIPVMLFQDSSVHVFGDKDAES